MAVVGLKNIYVAEVLTDETSGTTYGTPRKLSPAMTANITPNYENAQLHGDDKLQEVEDNLSSVDVEIGLNDLSLEDYAFLLGKTVDANGGVSDADETAPYVALGYQLPLSNGKGSRFVWLYKGKFTPPSEEAQTKEGAVTFQTPTVSGTFMQRESDSKWRYRIQSSDTNKAITDAWFESVVEAPSVTPGNDDEELNG